MAVTTTRYAKLDKPELKGGMVHQFGYAKFVAKGKTLSISTKLKTIRFFEARYRTGAPYRGSGTQIYSSGTITSNRLVCRRATASKLSGAYIWYEMLGY